eukprot:2198536-Rhodomonas_salina.1
MEGNVGELLHVLESVQCDALGSLQSSSWSNLSSGSTSSVVVSPVVLERLSFLLHIHLEIVPEYRTRVLLVLAMPDGDFCFPVGALVLGRALCSLEFA